MALLNKYASVSGYCNFSLFNSQVMIEPFVNCHYLGPERGSSRYSDTPVMQHCTYSKVKASLEDEFQGQRIAKY